MHINRGIINWALKECLILIGRRGLIGSLLACTKNKADFSIEIIHDLFYIVLSPNSSPELLQHQGALLTLGVSWCAVMLRQAWFDQWHSN